MTISRRLMAAAHRVGVPRLLDLYWGQGRLTVLAYHRVPGEAPGCDYPYYPPNVSATRDQFAQQMAYVATHFSVISLDDLVAHVATGEALPARPLLITFDDGYLDNYDHAFPVLKQCGFPAVIFLMTSRMTHPVPAWWDECAYYFFHTTQGEAALPLVGTRQLHSRAERVAARELVMQHLKRVPEPQKLDALQQISTALQVAPPPEDPALFLNWDQVRDLVSQGVACMPHTVTHPILTRITPEQQRQEITASRDHIRQETGQTIPAFAFPNGGLADYDRTTLRILVEEGFKIAFTLAPGPVRATRVRQHPLQIARVFLSARDTLDRFIFKIMGVPALQEPAQLIE